VLKKQRIKRLLQGHRLVESAETSSCVSTSPAEPCFKAIDSWRVLKLCLGCRLVFLQAGFKSIDSWQ
jgi:hypothetical protein